MSYGKAPELIGNYPLDGWAEYMHYMYLPVIMPERPGLRMPERLAFAADMVQAALDHESNAFNNRYNLAGNSHNYLFDYKWDMHPRAKTRNDPAYCGRTRDAA